MTRDICTDNNIFFEVYPTTGLMRNEVSDIILKKAHTSVFIGERKTFIKAFGFVHQDYLGST